VTMMGATGGTARAVRARWAGGRGSYVSNHYSADDPSPRVQDFIKKYQTKFGVVPDSLPRSLRLGARVIDGLKARHRQLGPALRDAIAATKDFPGVAATSPSTRSATGEAAVVLKIDGGKFSTSTRSRRSHVRVHSAPHQRLAAGTSMPSSRSATRWFTGCSS